MHITDSVPGVNGKPKVNTVFANDSALGLGDILEDAIGSRPEASARADKIILEQASNGPDQFGTVTIDAKRDASGTLFDPSQHEADSNGNPRTAANGNFRLKRGRKQGINYGGGDGGISVPAESCEETGAILTRAEALKAGRASAHLIFAAGATIFGAAEWTPLTKAQTGGVDEKEHLANGLADYYEVRGTVKLPPEIGLVLALSTVIVPRLQLPQTKATVTGFAARFKSLLGFKRKPSAPDALETPDTKAVVIPAAN